MKLTRQQLARALAGLKCLTKGKSTLPVLNSVRVTARADGLVTLAATNLDVLATHTIPPETAGSPLGRALLAARWQREVGDFLVPISVLAEAAKSSDRAESITLGSKTVTAIVGGQPQPVDYEVIPLAEWPSHPGWLKRTAEAREVTISSETILRGMECGATDESRFVLNGIFFDASAKGPKAHSIVGTDGRQMVSLNSLRFPWKSFILPSTPENRALFAVLAAEPTWTVRYAPSTKKQSTGVWSITAGPWTLHGKDVEGIYPNYRQVIPEASPVAVEFAPSVLRRMAGELPRLPLRLTNRPNDPARLSVRVDVKEDGISIRSEKAVLEFPAKVTFKEKTKDVPAGEPFTFGMNREFLIRAARFGLVSWGLRDEGSAIVASAPHATYVAMPLRDAIKPPVTTVATVQVAPSAPVSVHASPVTAEVVEF
jgi:hypothetical protein